MTTPAVSRATTTSASGDAAGSSVAAGKEKLTSATFVGFVGTQFLGAFNDNYFKQMVLLSCVSQMAVDQKDRQPLAMAAFALPFVLLSGLGGYLSDRFSKQGIIVLCKVGEIIVMAMALLALVIPRIDSAAQLILLIGVLSLMGAQSAIFGPSKYGVLPELFRSEQLILANGIVQMTTFLSIIFGLACAGLALDFLQRSLWMGSMIAVGIAVVGTATSLLIRRTVAAQPELPLRWENLALPREVWGLLRKRPAMTKAILVATIFWFIGGVAQPAVNVLGKGILGLSDTRTSFLVLAIGVGIAAGCLLVGVVAKNAGSVWVMRGAWGIVGSLFVTGILGSLAKNVGTASVADETIMSFLVRAEPIEWALRLSMMWLGVSAGVFVVPIQAYLQNAPPPEQKGRVIGVQNLCTWIGILLSAAFLGLINLLLAFQFGPEQAVQRHYVIFLILAFMMVPVAVWYRIEDPAEDLRGPDTVQPA